MKILIFFLPFLILALLESTFIPLNLTLIAVILWASRRPAKQGLTLAFFSGLILDLFSGRTLGFSSLLFLILTFPIYLYKNRFQANKIRFLLPFTLIAVVAFNLIESFLSPFSIIATLIALFFLLPIFDFITNVTDDESQPRLSLGEKL